MSTQYGNGLSREQQVTANRKYTRKVARIRDYTNEVARRLGGKDATDLMREYTAEEIAEIIGKHENRKRRGLTGSAIK